MQKKKLIDIIDDSQNLFLANITKPDKFDRRTWSVDITDTRWKHGNVDPGKLQMVTLRRGDGFFFAYKVMSESYPTYLVDPKKSMYRGSVNSYVKGLMNYSIYTNDISPRKKDNSFRLTFGQMKSEGIDNFLDLCYEYKDYSAIGIGLTRNIRNLVVLDIDVNCMFPSNRAEIERILGLFSGYGVLPNFIISNSETRHIQMQWLIKNLKYKTVNDEMVKKLYSELNSDSIKSRELNHTKIDFLTLTAAGMDYRKYTRALCRISQIENFGDENFTFWKAKNPMSALVGKYGLELMMPYLKGGKIEYLSKEQMESLFSSKESRKKYFSNAIAFGTLRAKTSELTSSLEESDATILMECDDDIYGQSPKYDRAAFERKTDARNSFVFNKTRELTWKLMGMGKITPKTISEMPVSEYESFKTRIYNEIRKLFIQKNSEYHGIWPDTSNNSLFMDDEFDSTFTRSYTYSIQNYPKPKYDDDDRRKSIETRHGNKLKRIGMISGIRRDHPNMTRNDLLDRINAELSNLGMNIITRVTLDRDITEMNKQTKSS